MCALNVQLSDPHVTELLMTIVRVALQGITNSHQLLLQNRAARHAHLDL